MSDNRHFIFAAANALSSTNPELFAKVFAMYASGADRQAMEWALKDGGNHSPAGRHGYLAVLGAAAEAGYRC